MQNLVFLTYFVHKLLKKNLWEGRLDPPPGEGRVNNRDAMATVEVAGKQNIYFWMLHT